MAPGSSPSPATTSSRPRSDRAGWRAAVFGLELHGSFAAPGLHGSQGHSAAGPRIEVRLHDDLGRAWPRNGATRLVDRRFDDGTPAVTIDWDDELGHMIFAAGYGRFRISGDGSLIECSPGPVEDWQWQRYLIGQVLPITAVLNGREVFHASAVAVNGRAVALAAGSRVGKTSAALNLVLRGHGFVTDDVLAVSLDNGLPVAHPGPAVTNLRDAERERMGEASERLGEIVGRDGHGLRIALRREERPLTLGAMYLLERVDGGSEVAFERVAPGFRLLFANSFDFLIGSSDRMRNQLEVYAALERSVPVFQVLVPPAVDASELAARVESHAARC